MFTIFAAGSSDVTFKRKFYVVVTLAASCLVSLFERIVFEMCTKYVSNMLKEEFLIGV